MHIVVVLAALTFLDPSVEGHISRPKNLSSWSVCTSWSFFQSELIGTWAAPLWESTVVHDGVTTTTVSDEVVEITFTKDRRYMKGIRGARPQETGRWCLDDDYLIVQFDTLPKGAESVPWQSRERIGRISETELVFTKTYFVWRDDTTAEGVYMRVR